MSFNGIYIQYHAKGSINKMFENLQKENNIIGCEKKCYKFEDDEVTKSFQADIIDLEYLITDKKIDRLVVLLNNNFFVNVPLGFCEKLCGLDHKSDLINGKFRYNLKKIWNMMEYGSIKIYELYYTGKNCSFIIEHEHDEISAKIMVSESYLSNIAANQLANISYIKQMMLFQETEIDLNTNHEISFALDFHLVAKGIFFEGINPSQLEYLKMNLNGLERFDYDTDMLTVYSYKVSDECFYISLNDKIDSYKKFHTGWEYSLNFDRIDQTRLKLKTVDNLNKKITVRAMSPNFYVVQQGLSGYRFGS